jgi:Tfp pilus assembly protein PilO
MGENGNGKWYGTSTVVRVLFWIVFLGVCGWGTYVWTRTEDAHTKIANAKTETAAAIADVKTVNTVQDERINRIKEDLTEIKNDQKEILRRLPR